MPKPNTLGKIPCFSSVIKCSPPHHHTPSTSPPQLLQNYHHHHPPPATTTLYNSLYEDSSTATSATTAPATPSYDTDEVEAAIRPTTPDLAAIYASRRFFISSPGMSNSIVDSSSPSSSSAGEAAEEEVAGGVPVQTYSPNPYVDFRRSMEEMVEAHDRLAGQEAWDYLQELLLTYLSLNPKSTHKYIVGAFADLVASLLISPNHILSH